jgi:hypothetical protein
MTEAQSEPKAKTPWHIWVVGIVAVLFNFIGVFDFSMTMMQGSTYMASAGMTPEQIAHYDNMPMWMTFVWAIGVFGAFGASILLLLKRKLSVPIFMISLTAFMLSLVYTYVLTGAGAIMGQQMAITSGVIAVLLAFFTLYARQMAKAGKLG